MSDMCSRRLIEIQRVYDYLLLNGHQVMTDTKKADYILLYACGFDKCTQEESIRRIKDLNHHKAQLIVVGCFPNINLSRIRENFPGLIFGRGQEAELDALFLVNTRFNEVGDANRLYKRYKHSGLAQLSKPILEKIGGIAPEPYCIQVGRGCLHHCSYCVDKLTVGNLVSKPVSEIVSEFEDGLKKGHKLFLLLADDLGAYGQDMGANFVELLGRLTAYSGNYIIRLEELNVKWLIKYEDEFCALMERARDKFSSWIIGFQSGNDRILGLMKRGYTRAQVLSLLENLKNRISLHCHVVIGFPTETESEFMDSIDLIEKGYFQSGDLFVYSDMEGAPSVNLYPKVPEEEKRKRLVKARGVLVRLGYFTYYRNENDLIFQRRKGVQTLRSALFKRISDLERVG